MATHNEMFELVDAAVHAIYDSLAQGDRQGYKERWRRQSLSDHIKHADMHLVTSGFGTRDSRHTELQHALIRVAMALVIHNGEVR